MSFCPNCGKYTFGNQYCYNCYQYNIEKNIAERNLTVSSKNTCLICNKLIDGIGYCIDCYKDHIILSPDKLTEELIYQNILNTSAKYKNELNTTNQNKTNTQNIKHKTYQKQEKEIFNQIDLQTFFTLPKITSQENIKLCKICNLNSHGKTYCYGCYQKIQTGQIKDFKDLHNDSLKFICENGNIVRSQGERTISDFLYKNNIPFR